MSIVLEELFHAVCTPYDPETFQKYIRNNPAAAYGQYTFEEGFKLAFRLAVCCLAEEELDPDE